MPAPLQASQPTAVSPSPPPSPWLGAASLVDGQRYLWPDQFHGTLQEREGWLRAQGVGWTPSAHPFPPTPFGSPQPSPGPTRSPTLPITPFSRQPAGTTPVASSGGAAGGSLSLDQSRWLIAEFQHSFSLPDRADAAVEKAFLTYLTTGGRTATNNTKKFVQRFGDGAAMPRGLKDRAALVLRLTKGQ